MISLNCNHCDCCFLSASPSKDQPLEAFLASWKSSVVNNDDVYHCVTCGGRFRVEDDGVDVSLGGSVVLVDVSSPGIESLTLMSGPRTGGYALYIFGRSLDIGDLIVKFGGKPCSIVDHREYDRARVVLPQGQYTINVQDYITPGFIVGEEVAGLDSNARAVVRTVSPFVVDAPSKAFSANEEIKGLASNARIRASDPAYVGTVDVSVENEHGQRLNGGVVLNGFTYE